MSCFHCSMQLSVSVRHSLTHCAGCYSHPAFPDVQGILAPVDLGKFSVYTHSASGMGGCVKEHPSNTGY